MKLDVINQAGTSTGRSFEIADDLFTAEPNMHLIYLSVKQYLANQRQGTHKSKERNEIAGSTRKLHKQKGTGGSRKGDIKSPVLHGGGRVFGPRPRDYRQEMNKKTRRAAKIAALSHKINNNKLLVVEDFNMEAPKTKELATFFAAVNASKKPLLITTDKNQNIYLSGRNIEKGGVTFANELNVYDMVNADTLIFFEGAIDQIVKSLTKN